MWPFSAAARWPSAMGLDPRALRKRGDDQRCGGRPARAERAGGLGQVGDLPPAENQETTFPLEMEGGCAACLNSKSWWSPKTPNGGGGVAQGGGAGERWISKTREHAIQSGRRSNRRFGGLSSSGTVAMPWMSAMPSMASSPRSRQLSASMELQRIRRLWRYGRESIQADLEQLARCGAARAARAAGGLGNRFDWPLVSACGGPVA